jgi:DNA invertase Pin-like site-specific DNA recombinase
MVRVPTHGDEDRRRIARERKVLIAERVAHVIVERTNAGLSAARARGRKGGRKAILSAKQIECARKLLEDRNTTIKEVAERFDVNRATIYRALGLGKWADNAG